MKLSRQEVLLIGSLLTLALLFGWLLDAFGWTLFIAALIWGLVQHRERTRLQTWAEQPLRRPINAMEPWQTSAFTLYQNLIPHKRYGGAVADHTVDAAAASRHCTHPHNSKVWWPTCFAWRDCVV